MNKSEYLNELKERLTAAAIANVESRIEYYSEMIDDRIEDGMTEEEAVNSMESIDSIIQASMPDRTVSELVMEKVKNSKKTADRKGHGALWIILAILGFPIWFPLLLTFFLLFLSLYIVLGSIVIALFGVVIAFGAAAIGSLFAPFFTFSALGGIGFIGAVGLALIFGGLAYLLWKPIVALCKIIIKSFSACIRAIKHWIFN